MRRRYTKRTSCRKASRKEWQKGQTGKARQVQLTLDAEEVLTMLWDSLTAYPTEIGQKLPIQRCQVHKKRNVREHLPQKHWKELSRQLHAAYHETDYDQALKGLKTTARWLERLNPDAAASLREGMEETLTVVRLGVPELLRRTLATTNPIESAFSVAENVTRRVKRWRDGDMRQRWSIAGLLRAESKFRRVKGHGHMPQLLKALDRLVLGKGLDEHRKIA